MVDGGTSMSIPEIAYNLIVIMVFIVFIGSIFFISDPNRLHAIVVGKEISYLSMQSSNYDTQIALNTEKIVFVDVVGNTLNVKADGMKTPYQVDYIGNSLLINVENRAIFINYR